MENFFKDKSGSQSADSYRPENKVVPESFLIMKNKEIKTKTPKTKLHSPITVIALKNSVKYGERICSIKFIVEKSSCLINSIV